MAMIVKKMATTVGGGVTITTTLLQCLLMSSVAHIALLIYGELHDRSATVKFTDVDYFVFTDAADLVAAGQSPFDRATYRYSPLLAWLLLPGSTVLPKLFGKVLFCTASVALGFLIHAVLRRQGVGNMKSIYCACAWLFNPMAMVVSARGNAESLLAVLVVGSLLLMLDGRTMCAGVVLGAAVHLKLYPVIYALPLYFACDITASATTPFRKVIRLLRPNRSRVELVCGALLGFVAPTLLCWMIYGDHYVDQALLHHLRRHDIKHNFSPYFYLLYLTADAPERWMSTAAFLPQVAIVAAVALRYRTRDDLPFCLLLQTIAFVTFNKVCTSQYFLWYLSLFPLAIPRLRFAWQKLVKVTSLWVFSQAVWLFAAYVLEFEGRDTFMYVWLAGLVFFVANIYVMDFLITAYKLARDDIDTSKKR